MFTVEIEMRDRIMPEIEMRATVDLSGQYAYWYSTSICQHDSRKIDLDFNNATV